MIDKANNKQRLVSLLFVLAPILNVYATGISGLGVGDATFLVLLGFLVLNRGVLSFTIHTIRIDKSLIVFAAYAIVSTMMNVIINHYSFNDALVRLIVMIFYITIIVVLSSNGVIDIKYACRIYLVSATVCSIGVLLQVIYHYSFGNNLFLLIPFLNFNQSTLPNYNILSRFYNYMYTFSFRPTSFFLEPSHFSLYVTGALAVLLNNNFTEMTERRKMINAAIISIAMLLSASGTGYLLLAVCWLNYTLRFFKQSKINSKQFFLFIIALSVVLYIAFTNEYYDVLVNRIGSINNGTDSSINVRVLKGFYFLKELNPIEWLFGIGCGNYNSYVQVHNLLDTMFEHEYMNSVSYVLVSTGLVGMILFAIYLHRIFKLLHKKNNHIFIFAVLAMYFTGSVAFSWHDSLPLVLSIVLSNNEL